MENPLAEFVLSLLNLTTSRLVRAVNAIGESEDSHVSKVSNE